MNKLYVTAIIILFIATGNLYSQVIVVNTANVSLQNTSAFEANEMNYYSVIAKNAITEGKLMGWYFFKMYESDNVDSVSNYLFVNTFESEEQLFENNWFDISEEKINDSASARTPSRVTSPIYPAFKYVSSSTECSTARL